jgi:hypothetical protein
VGALVAVYTKNGPKILDNVLQILSATWPNDQAATGSNLVRGYGLFLGEWGSAASWGHLKVCVNRFTPNSLLAAAKQRQEIDGGTLDLAVSHTLLSLYNKRPPGGKSLTRKS